MSSVTKIVFLDIHSIDLQKTITISKGSVRRLLFTFADKGETFDLCECTAVLRMPLADGTSQIIDCQIEKNTALCDLLPNVSDNVGEYECEVILSDPNGEQIAVPRFALIVQDTLYSANEIECDTELQVHPYALDNTGDVDTPDSDLSQKTAAPTEKLFLDIHSLRSQETLCVSKCDAGRIYQFCFVDNGKTFDLTGYRAVFRARKSDGSVLFNKCKIEDNTAVYKLTAQTTAICGEFDCEISLYGIDGKNLTSPKFTMIVGDTLYSDEEVESRDEFSALQEIFAETQNLNIELSEGENSCNITVTGKDGKKKVITLEDGDKGDPFTYDDFTPEQLKELEGEDGETPYIGNNGNWWIGNEDTGEPVRAETITIKRITNTELEEILK